MIVLIKFIHFLTGITDLNKEEVEWCVDTSGLEKKVRHAARKLYKTMNDTHKEVMTKEDYITAVKKVTGGDVLEQKLLLAAGNFDIIFDVFIVGCFIIKLIFIHIDKHTVADLY